MLKKTQTKTKKIKEMQHRHIYNQKKWLKAAIHSILGHGSDSDILELKEAVKKDKELALLVYDYCQYEIKNIKNRR